MNLLHFPWFHLILHRLIQFFKTDTGLVFTPSTGHESQYQEREKSLSFQLCQWAFQSVRNVLDENNNLIILAPCEGQEVIIKWSFSLQGLWWKRRSWARGCRPSGLDRLKVDRIRYCFQKVPTHTQTFLYWWMCKYAFLALRALTSTESQNLDFVHTKAVFHFKKFKRTIQLSF